MTVCSPARRGATWRHIRCVCGKPCRRTTGDPEPELSWCSLIMDGTVATSDQQPISEFGILGPVVAFRNGEPLKLGGPMHRALLARLIVARGAVVSVDRLIDDLSTTRGAIRTFVSDLRKALDRDLLVTEGAGYALRTERVDAW